MNNIDMEDAKKQLVDIKELLMESSEDLNKNPYLLGSANFVQSINVLLDEILRIKKATGKNFNAIKHLLRP